MASIRRRLRPLRGRELLRFKKLRNKRESQRDFLIRMQGQGRVLTKSEGKALRTATTAEQQVKRTSTSEKIGKTIQFRDKQLITKQAAQEKARAEKIAKSIEFFKARGKGGKVIIPEARQTVITKVRIDKPVEPKDTRRLNEILDQRNKIPFSPQLFQKFEETKEQREAIEKQDFREAHPLRAGFRRADEFISEKTRLKKLLPFVEKQEKAIKRQAKELEQERRTITFKEKQEGKQTRAFFTTDLEAIKGKSFFKVLSGGSLFKPSAKARGAEETFKSTGGTLVGGAEGIIKRPVKAAAYFAASLVASKIIGGVAATKFVATKVIKFPVAAKIFKIGGEAVVLGAFGAVKGIEIARAPTTFEKGKVVGESITTEIVPVLAAFKVQKGIQAFKLRKELKSVKATVKTGEIGRVTRVTKGQNIIDIGKSGGVIRVEQTKLFGLKTQKLPTLAGKTVKFKTPKLFKKEITTFKFTARDVSLTQPIKGTEKLFTRGFGNIKVTKLSTGQKIKGLTAFKAISTPKDKLIITGARFQTGFKQGKITLGRGGSITAATPKSAPISASGFETRPVLGKTELTFIETGKKGVFQLTKLKAPKKLDIFGSKVTKIGEVTDTGLRKEIFQFGTERIGGKAAITKLDKQFSLLKQQQLTKFKPISTKDLLNRQTAFKFQTEVKGITKLKGKQIQIPKQPLTTGAINQQITKQLSKQIGTVTQKTSIIAKVKPPKRIIAAVPALLQKEKAIVKGKEIQKEIQIPKIITDVSQTSKEIQIPKIAQIPKQSQAPRQAQIPKQIQLPELIQIPKLAQLPKLIQLSRPTPPRATAAPFILPPLLKPPRKRPQAIEQGFDVFVRRRGKFFKVNLKDLGKSQALRKGAGIVQETAAATFKIEPTGRIVKRRKKKGGLPALLGQFRQKGKLLIEKRRFRINAPTELEQITFKGIAAQRKGRGIFK